VREMPFVKLNFQFMHFFGWMFCCLFAFYRARTNDKGSEMGSNPPNANTFHTKYKYLLMPHAGDTETQTKCQQWGKGWPRK